jgi:dTMP kinase
MRGKLITLEGIDGAGKSTHLAWLADHLRRRDRSVRMTREPGGTALGESLRALLLDPTKTMNAETETLLMFAARREHLDHVIEPALARGEWIVCDRFTDATFAYQGGGRGVDWERLRTLEKWVQRGLEADLTLLFDVPCAVGRDRAGHARGADRFEQEEHDFFERVRAAYLRRAAEAPERIKVLNATRSIAQVQQELAEIADVLCL